MECLIVHIAVVVLVAVNQRYGTGAIHKLLVDIETGLRQTKIQAHYRIVVIVCRGIRKLPILIIVISLYF
jgi:hypothetical protein